ncbi:uncharacterized protein LOC143917883 [Arctopsyche grandis]|uniref:uncharacterized protein LOC143917883 n=1 Tax=Arctopsyche grandis TaxID=121162 RepID=UPI00406D873E
MATVIPRGTMVDEIKACLKSSQLWKHVKTMKLTTNMRVLQSDSSKHFCDYLLNIGNGKEATTASGKIKLSFGEICSTVEVLIDRVYPNKSRKWLKNRTILTTLNVNVEEINHLIQNTLTTQSRTFFSIDKCVNEDEATSYPVEYLNSLNPSGLPSHKLDHPSCY